MVKPLLVTDFFWGGPSCDTGPPCLGLLRVAMDIWPKLHILIETPFSVIVLSGEARCVKKHSCTSALIDLMLFHYIQVSICSHEFK